MRARAYAYTQLWQDRVKIDLAADDGGPEVSFLLLPDDAFHFAEAIRRAAIQCKPSLQPAGFVEAVKEFKKTHELKTRKRKLLK